MATLVCWVRGKSLVRMRHRLKTWEDNLEEGEEENCVDANDW